LAQSGIAFFSIGMTYSFLNFRVGVGQQGFWIKVVKCIGSSNLSRIVGIPVDLSSDKQVWLCLE